MTHISKKINGIDAMNYEQFLYLLIKMVLENLTKLYFTCSNKKQKCIFSRSTPVLNTKLSQLTNVALISSISRDFYIISHQSK